MNEISNGFMIAWTIAVAILWTGISWGTVRVTLKISQRNFEKRIDDLTKGWKYMEHRLTEDEKSYMTRVDCNRDRAECDKHRDYHEGQLMAKLDGVKEFMIMMDDKREKTRTELSTKLTMISEELAVLKADIARGQSWHSNSGDLR